MNKIYNQFFITVFLFVLILSHCAGGAQVQPIVGELKSYSAYAGESLYSIALKYDVAIDHLMMANNINGYYVPSGRNLIIPRMWILPKTLNEGIVINLPERALYFFKDGQFKIRYPITIGGTGRWETPCGDFSVANKTVDPIWLPPEWAGIDDPVMPGPSNPLGDRWIGLSSPGLGIHSTNSPMSIGLVGSHGCIRMYPDDARALYTSVTVGMPVFIVYQPIKIGYSAQTRKYYLEVYPDVYYRGGSDFGSVFKKLQDLGLDELVDDAVIEELVYLKNGVPTPIIGSDIVAKVNSQVVELSFPIINKNGKMLVPGEVFEAAGISFYNDKTTQTLLLQYDNKVVEIPLGSKQIKFNGEKRELSQKAVVIKGNCLLPLRDICELFGIPFEWDAEKRTIQLFISNKISHEFTELSKKNFYFR